MEEPDSSVMQWSHDIIVYSKVNYISQNLHAAGDLYGGSPKTAGDLQGQHTLEYYSAVDVLID